VFDVP